MKTFKRLTCAAMAMLLLLLSACSFGNVEPDPPAPHKLPTVTPDASGQLTFGDQTFSTDVEKLTLHIDIRSNEILDLSPLSWCTQLRSLSVNVTITPHIYYDMFDDPHIMEMTPVDLRPLTALANLEVLKLNVGPIDDLSPLTQLPNLKNLVLWAEGELDLRPLTGCAGLTTLALGGRASLDLSQLKGCTALNNLRVDVYAPDWTTPDLSALSGMPALETLSTGGCQGLRALKDVPLRSILDLNDSGDILENLPQLSTLDYISFSDEHIDDIAPLLLLSGLTQIALEVGAQEIESFTVITPKDSAMLDSLITNIPTAQLRELLSRGVSITITVDKNRPAGIMK